jgi:hypothetical protein
MINKAYETLIIDKHIYRTPNTLASFVTYFESAEPAQYLATKSLWTHNNERPHTEIGGLPSWQLLETA